MKIVQVIYRQEQAFAGFYNRHLRRAELPDLEIFLRGQKMKPWEAECSMFDLAQMASSRASPDSFRKPRSASCCIRG